MQDGKAREAGGDGVPAGAPGPGDEAARKRVAVEMVARYERALRRTARRYSICAADAEDAFQRALEILLTKAPPGEARELVRWMQTVTKHEALAIRSNRERQVSPPLKSPDPGEEPGDLLSLLPSQGPGPAERAERREAIARSREALKTLKPAELRALTLLAQGYSYAEIGEMTGYSRTKINRCLAEGRERFRSFLTHSESGGRCAELRPLLSAFCDGEADAEEEAVLREHLRVCAHCRSVLRSYRAAPGAAAGFVPVLPLLGPLLGRAREAIAAVQARVLPRPSALAQGSAAQIVAGGGSRGAGMTALAKLLAVCAGTAGGAAACMSAGIVQPPAIAGLGSPGPSVAPHIARSAPEAVPAPTAETPEPAVVPGEETSPAEPKRPTAAKEPPPQPEPAGAVEYEAEAPPPEPIPEPATPVASAEGASAPAAAAAGSPAGEFGP
jgi:RNA polymerase sigma factor (sigma-70 family)